MLMKFEQFEFGPNLTKFWALWPKKTLFFKIIFDKALTYFLEDVLYLKQLFTAKLLNWRLPSFSVPKIMSDTCNHVKSRTKHGRPD